MYKNFIRIIYILLFIVSFLFSQHNLWDVQSASESPYMQVKLLKVQNDSLHMTSYGNNYILHLDSIKSVRQERGSHGGGGLILGMIGGGILGNHLAETNSSESGPFSAIGEAVSSLFATTLGIIVGGIVGYAVGANQPAGKTYEFDKLSIDEKRYLLNEIINRKHKPIRF